MHDAGFTDITTLECLQRVLDVRSVSVPVANLGYGSANSYCDLGTKSERGNKPVTGHIEAAKPVYHQKPKKAKHVTATGDNENDAVCVDDEENDEPAAEVSDETQTKADNRDSHKQPWTKASYNFKSAMPVSQVTGHTGYLTFATLYPK